MIYCIWVFVCVSECNVKTERGAKKGPALCFLFFVFVVNNVIATQVVLSFY